MSKVCEVFLYISTFKLPLGMFEKFKFKLCYRFNNWSIIIAFIKIQ